MKKTSTIFSNVICLFCGIQVGMCWGRNWFYVILSIGVAIVTVVGDGIIQCYDDSDSGGDEKI